MDYIPIYIFVLMIVVLGIQARLDRKNDRGKRW